MRVKRESPAASRGTSPDPGSGARRPRRAAAETAVHRMALIAPKFRSRKEIEAAAAARRAFLEAARCVPREAPPVETVARTRPSDFTRKVHDVTRPHAPLADTDSKAALRHLVQEARSVDGHANASEPAITPGAEVEAVRQDTDGACDAPNQSASRGGATSVPRGKGESTAVSPPDNGGEIPTVEKAADRAGQPVAMSSNHCPAQSPAIPTNHCPAESPTVSSNQTRETCSTQSRPSPQNAVAVGPSPGIPDLQTAQQSSAARHHPQPTRVSPPQVPLAKTRASVRAPAAAPSDVAGAVDASRAALPACVAPGRAGVGVRPPLAPGRPHTASWTNHGMPVPPSVMDPSACTPAFAAALAACQARALGMQMPAAAQGSPAAGSLPHSTPVVGSVLPNTLESNRTVAANFRTDSGDHTLRSVTASAMGGGAHVIDLSGSSPGCDLPTRNLHVDHALHRRAAPYSIPPRQKSPQQLSFGSAAAQGEADLVQVQHLQAQRLQQIRREIHELQQQTRDQNRGRPQHQQGSTQIVGSSSAPPQDGEISNVPATRPRSANSVLPSVAVLENQLHECEERRAYLRRLLRGGAPGRRDWPSPSEARSLLETAGASAGKFQGDRWFAWGNDPLPSTRSLEWRLARVLDRPALDAAALGDATMWGVLCLTLGAIILGADVDELRTGLAKLGVPVPDSLGSRTAPTQTSG